MTSILGPILAGALLMLGAVLKNQAKTPRQLFEEMKEWHRLNNKPEPLWSDNASYVEARSKDMHMRANASIAGGVLLVLVLVFN